MSQTSEPRADAGDNFVLQLMRGETPMHRIGETLGARYGALDLDAGTLEMAFEGRDAFLNPAGRVQGGILAAMLDDVTASLLTATAATGEVCSTLDMHVSFLRPVRPGPIEGRARLVRRGRQVSSVHGELRQDGELVATATATCMLASLRPRP